MELVEVKDGKGNYVEVTIRLHARTVNMLQSHLTMAVGYQNYYGKQSLDQAILYAVLGEAMGQTEERTRSKIGAEWCPKLIDIVSENRKVLNEAK